MAPAQIVSSRLNLSFHPEPKTKMSRSEPPANRTRRPRLFNDPITTVSLSFAMLMALVPLVVVSTTVWPFMAGSM